ncbi:hypothetical protein DdX_20062 [Ditylenchus destructor]|uniref:Uncharacterized protein n=1 Tax=Ditylenchus destructor TaxID=166010 RepID=A0AAD4QWW4_9BILA|nr:hypothetical protein DdX_20062 [Ditylenchus destructor]
MDNGTMNSYVSSPEPASIRIFNEKPSSEKYIEWIVRNGYSKQIPLEDKIVGKENDRDIYEFRADISHNPNHCHDITTDVFYAYVELKDDYWPVFQHFFRLLMDPFIYIRYLSLNPQKALSLLAGAMNPDRGRLQCKKLKIDFNGDVQKLIIWIKDHVCCDEFGIAGANSNYDEEVLDLFMTGAPCTSTIYVKRYELSKFVDLVQKFMALKNRDEYQVVESIWGYVKHQADVEALKRNCAEFIAEEEKSDQQHEQGRSTRHVIGFINKDIEKKLTLDVTIFSFALGSFSIKITNL